MNNLERKLQGMTAEEDARLLDGFDPQPCMDPAALDRIAGRISRSLAPESTKAKRFLKKAWKPALIAAAACAALFLTLGFTVPGVADGLYRLSHPDMTTETYFMQKPDEREPITAIEAAVEGSDPEDLSGCVQIVGSYSGELESDSEYNRYAFASENRPAVDPDEYAYLLTLKPELREVYYDGRKLIMTAYFDCPYAGDFLYGFGNFDVAHSHNLDMRTFEVLGTMNGTPVSFGSFGHGVIPSYNEQETGFYMQTDVDLDSPLPDGVARMTLYYYIYNEDDIKTGGSYNVARVKHTFSFDTTAGNAHAAQTVRLSLSGSAPMMILRSDETTGDFETIETRTVSLDGLTLSLELSYLPGGAVIDVMPETYPESFDDAMKQSLFLRPDAGLQFDVYVNGTFLKTVVPLPVAGNAIRTELPIHADDSDTLRSVTLIPKLVRITRFIPILDRIDGSVTGDPVTLEPDADPISLSIGGIDRLETAEALLSNCAIDLPLPTP